MTENEAKEILENDSCYECTYGTSFGASECKNKDCEIANATKLAIQALEEIQQYRAMGTVDEFKALKEKNEPKKPTDTRYFGEAGYYIGLCPTCKSGNNSEFQYCGDCGQKLDWE